MSIDLFSFLPLSFVPGGFSSFQNAYPNFCTKSGLKLLTSMPSGPGSLPASAPVCTFQDHPLQRRSSSTNILSIVVASPQVAAEGRGTCETAGPVSTPHATGEEGRTRETAAPAELAPYLLLGSLEHACNREVLRKAGVTAVLNVSNQCDHYFPGEFLYKRIPVEDSNAATLMPHFQEAAEFIGKNVLCKLSQFG